MKTKYRVDTLLIGNIHLNMQLEKFLDRCAEQGWEVLHVIQQGDAVTIISRKIKRWWQ